jgi:hypothetical protein
LADIDKPFSEPSSENVCEGLIVVIMEKEDVGKRTIGEVVVEEMGLGESFEKGPEEVINGRIDVGEVSVDEVPMGEVTVGVVSVGEVSVDEGVSGVDAVVVVVEVAVVLETGRSIFHPNTAIAPIAEFRLKVVVSIIQYPLFRRPVDAYVSVIPDETVDKHSPLNLTLGAMPERMYPLMSR